MNRDATATRISNSRKRSMKDTCWSSEWSFVEQTDIATQKQTQPSVAEKQSARNYPGTAMNLP